jgi:hypothetical protein
MPYPEEPTAAVRRELERGLPRLSCRTANARVRVDALEEMLSCSVHVEMS